MRDDQMREGGKWTLIQTAPTFPFYVRVWTETSVRVRAGWVPCKPWVNSLGVNYRGSSRIAYWDALSNDRVCTPAFDQL